MRSRIIQELIAFESAHPVEHFAFRDIHVWPLLRINAGFDLERTLNGPEFAPGFGTVRTQNRLMGYRLLFQRLVRSLLKSRAWKSPRMRKHGTVAILTHSNRRTHVGDKLWHPIADPIGLQIQKAGYRVVIWELGPELGPTRYPSIWITPILDCFQRMLRKIRSEEQVERPIPAWWRDFNLWRVSRGLSPSCWEEFARCIAHLLRMAEVFRWLLILYRVQRLVVDCWYNHEAQAATIAGRWLGIPTFEFQHGLQGNIHFAYNMWTKKPARGYESIPETFLVWGREHIGCPSYQRPGLRDVVVGNPWLSLWSTGSDIGIQQAIDSAKKCQGQAEKLILVTHQPACGLHLPAEAIERSPPQWMWLIRIHPHHKTDVKDENSLKKLKTLSNVRILDWTDGPLYAFLSACTVHVTGFSTCALEALAFGKPSVIFDHNGFEAFQKYISHGVMFFANNSQDLLNCIEEASYVDSGVCKQLARDLFLPTGQLENALLGALSEKSEMSKFSIGQGIR